MPVGIDTGHEDLVLDGKRREFTCTHTDECERTCRGAASSGSTANPFPFLAGREEPETGGKEEPLPGMRSHGESEQRIIGAGHDTVRAGILPVRPPPGKFIHTFERVERDGTVPDLRPDDAYSPAARVLRGDPGDR